MSRRRSRAAATLAATLLLAAVSAGAPLLATPRAARAQTDDMEALEAALADAYTAEPADPLALRAVFERLKVRQGRSFRVEAGLALAEGALALASEDPGAAERAREAGEKASALNPDHRLSSGCMLPSGRLLHWTEASLRVWDTGAMAPGSATNLRVCPGTVDVVAVQPYPAPADVWAPAALCAAPSP